jgi:hypothetical protein
MLSNSLVSMRLSRTDISRVARSCEWLTSYNTVRFVGAETVVSMHAVKSPLVLNAVYELCAEIVFHPMQTEAEAIQLLRQTAHRIPNRKLPFD